VSTRLEDDRPSAGGTAPETSTPVRGHYRELARQLHGVGVVNRELARRLPHDCPPASAGLLTLLHRHGEVRMSRLTELLGIDLSVTSRHVGHAEERGWIERLPDPHDGRSRLLRLTPSGEHRLDELSELTTETMREFLADWSTEDVSALTTLLDRLGSAFGDCRARGGGPDTPPAAPAPRSPATGASAPGPQENRTR
jgi:DNA-binding MarR family transcriptional regulator